MTRSDTTRETFPARKQVRTIWVVACLGVLLSVFLFWIIQRQLGNHKQIEFEWVARNRIRAIKHGIELAFNGVDSLREVVAVSDPLREATFQDVSRSILRRSAGIEALAWAPMREGEDEVRVLFQEPGRENGLVVGLSKALSQALASDEMIIQGPVEPGGGEDADPAFLCCAPVARRGFVVGQLDLEEIARSSTALLEPRGVEFLITDVTDPRAARIMAFYASRLGQTPGPDGVTADAWPAAGRARLSELFDVADRRWSVTCAPTDRFRSAEAFEQGPWVALVGGLLFTAIMILYLVRSRQSMLQRIRMEGKLHEREELFWQMTETVDDAFWALSPDGGRFLYMSPAYEKIWGLPCERVYEDPRTHLAAIHEKDRDGYTQAIEQICREAVEAEVTYRVLQDGTVRWVRDCGYPVVDRAGAVVRVVGVAEDVTDQRELHEQAARTARLASIGVLAAGVAHEVNNPNNAILFSSSLLERAWRDAWPILEEYGRENGDFSLGGLSFQEEGTTLSQLGAEIGRNSERIRRIVENLKHLGRDDSGDLSAAVDIVKVIEAAVEILQNQIRKHTDVFSVDLAETLPPVKGHSQQLEQVFINIILNALQSLPDRDRAVRIRATADAERNVVEVSVEDEGRGVADRDLDQLTEPFFSTRTKSGGTGLGLAISRSIVERHRGSIRFSSNVGVGTTVTVALPTTTGEEGA